MLLQWPTQNSTAPVPNCKSVIECFSNHITSKPAYLADTCSNNDTKLTRHPLDRVYRCVVKFMIFTTMILWGRGRLSFIKKNRFRCDSSCMKPYPHQSIISSVSPWNFFCFLNWDDWDSKKKLLLESLFWKSQIFRYRHKKICNVACIKFCIREWEVLSNTINERVTQCIHVRNDNLIMIHTSCEIYQVFLKNILFRMNLKLCIYIYFIYMYFIFAILKL